MAQFVQTSDNYAFNPDHVMEIDWQEDCAIVSFAIAISDKTGRPPYWREFSGDDYDALLDWWEHKAEVDRR